MTYDFFVLPAERADDLPAALAAYEDGALGTPAPADGAVGRFVAALREAALGDLLPAGLDGTADGSHVCTGGDDPAEALALVAGVAAAHDLAVLDVETGTLYDPRRSVPVTLRTEAGPRLPFVSRAVLRGVVERIEAGGYRWLTLVREEQFAQAFRDDDGSWAVEHRDEDGHFLARLDDPGVVADLLWSWARGDGRWQSMVEFSPVRV